MKLKENINFKDLEKYGFVEDPSNTRYDNPYDNKDNNYYYKFNRSYSADFRLICNMYTREFKILAIRKNIGSQQLCDLDIFMKLIKDGLVE